MKLNHRHQRLLFFSLILLILLIPACASEIQNPTQPVKTLIPATSTLPAIVATPISSPTANIVATSTSQPTPAITIEQKCLTLEDQLPLDLQLTGVWIRQPGKPYLENQQENTKYRVPLDGGGILRIEKGSGVVSPNGKWLAYLDTNYDTTGKIKRATGSTLKIINSSGHSLSMDYWSTSFQKIDGWADDQHLLLELNYFSETNRHLVILNPFSGEWKYVIEPDWFNQVSIERRLFDSVVYSPNLNEVILQLKDHSELRDLKTGALLFGNPNIGVFYPSTWSNDNVMLATITNKELYVFQGKEEILQFDLSKDHLVHTNEGNVYIRNLSWSVDHNSLLLETYDESLVFDIKQRNIFVLCFNDKHIKYLSWSESFLYPGNGEFLVTRIIQEILPSYEQRPFEILVDIKNKRAYKLTESMYYQDRIGWLASP